jgi:hypothetical protein
MYPKAMRAESALFVLGRDEAGARLCGKVQIPVRPAHVELNDCISLEPIGRAQYCGNAFTGELTIPATIFSSTHSLFVKLERRSWFFDEAGWVEVSAVRPEQIVAGRVLVEENSLAIR